MVREYLRKYTTHLFTMLVLNVISHNMMSRMIFTFTKQFFSIYTF